MADSFIQKLRMANIFGGAKPFGMPDFNSGNIDARRMANTAYHLDQQAEDNELRRKKSLMAFQGNLANIARGVTRPGAMQQQQKPMDVVYDRGMSDFQKAGLALKEKELSQRRDIESEKLAEKSDYGDRRLAIDRDKLELQERLKDLPDSEKIALLQSGRISLEDLKQTGRMALQNVRGKQAREQIGLRGDESRKTQEMEGTQALAQIAARVAGQKEVEGFKVSAGAGKEMTPEQERVAQINAARQLVNTDPQLGQHIEFDEKGNPIIKKDADERLRNIINQRLYGKDTNLPPGVKKTGTTYSNTSSGKK